jgi:hypothetical protein
MSYFFRRPSSLFHKICRASLPAVLVVCGLSGTPVMATPSRPVPRLLPTTVPPSYVVTSVEELTDRYESEQSQAFLRNSANTKAILVVAEPYEQTAWDRDVRQYLDGKVKFVLVQGRPAFITDDSSGIRSLIWFDRDRTFLSYSTGNDLATQRQLAEAVSRTDLSRSSFSLKSVPRGFKTVFTGPTRALSSGYSTVIYTSDPRNANSTLSIEVRRIDRRYVELFYLSPLAGTSEPITVQGKPGYRSTSVAGTKTIWYEDQPGLLVALSSSTMSDKAVLDVANSMTPTTEAAWTTVVQQAIDYNANVSVAPKLVGAGVVDSQVWTAQNAARANCLVFTVALTPFQTCVANPNVLGWSTIAVEGKPLVVGVASANVVAVVLKVNGREFSRAAVSPVIGQPTLRLFVFSLAADAPNVTITGLDVNGTEIQASTEPFSG